MKPFLRWLVILIVTVVVWLPGQAPAKDEYARATGQGCIFCHQEATGGQLKTAGFAYIRNGYRYPISAAVLEKAENLQGPLHKSLRFVLGYIHLLAAVIFCGAIFYIHIFIRPTSLTSGIPKPERVLGLSCMALLTATGVYLTWARIDRWELFFDNTFGLMLFVKILLFAAMVAIGLTAVTVIHRRMGAESRQESLPATGKVSAANLAQFDGSGAKPAYIVHQGQVYDVSASPKWKDGRHFGKHTAGTDLTAAMAGAPHPPEILQRLPCLGPLDQGQGPAPVSRTRRVFVVMAYTNLVLVFLILACVGVWRWDFPLRLIPEQRADARIGLGCVGCHQEKTPAVHADWKQSVHGRLGVDCYKCHQVQDKALALQAHLKHDPTPIAVVVTPTACRGCHPKQAEQYARSKHANTWAIMWQVDHWLKDGMNNEIERTSGCLACHGTKVELDQGRPRAGTWPNVGVGRLNPDGSLGSCSACHTRHLFSITEARKPEACDQCHLGPDHPQIEIYNESKHGTIYHAEKNRWRFDTDDRHWIAGRDFRAPTCAACHMSAAGKIPASHDVTERLSWETQAPLTIRPEEFAAFPSPLNWQAEREKMKTVCRQCHSQTWTDAHYDNLDAVVVHYNQTYYLPIKTLMDGLYADGLLTRPPYFDEPIEWEYYELWHHEGRRARMGTAMMAPDYAWWHGFYELKHRFNHLIEDIAAVRAKGGDKVFTHFPGRMDTDGPKGPKAP